MAKEYYGYNPPFFGGHQNVLSRQAGDRIIKNDLLQLIMTNLGERVMRPTWGTILGATLFEQITEVNTVALEDNIEQAIIDYEPRVNVAVSVTADDDRNQLSVRVEGTFTNEPNNTFELELELPFQRTLE